MTQDVAEMRKRAAAAHPAVRSAAAAAANLMTRS